MLAINNLNVYYGQSQIINDVTVKVAEGQAVCLMGRNGVGKTTLLKTIIGNLNSRGGKIVYENSDLTHQAAHRRARIGIGYVPQGRGIFPYLTVYENVLIGFEAAPKMTAAEQKESVEDVFELFPILYDRQEQKAGTLSGGERQMLAIGRALMARPRMMILDEPSLGLAPLIVANTFQIIQHINSEGVTILIVEQNVRKALEISSYAYIIEAGVIASEGTSTDLLSDQRIQNAYLPKFCANGQKATPTE